MKKPLVVLLAASLTLTSCKFWDRLFNKNKGGDTPVTPEPSGGDDTSPTVDKYIVSVDEVYAPPTIQQGKQLFASEVTAKVTYSDGTTAVVNVDRVELITTTVGIVTGKVKVGNFQKTFTIEVVEAPHEGEKYAHGVFTLNNEIDPTEGAEDEISYTDVVLTNNSEENINVRISNSTVNSSTKEVEAQADSFVTISNKEDSPLNDVSRLSASLNMDHYKYQYDIPMMIYFSYNHLSLNDIFNGKYQDLEAFYLEYSTNGYSASLDTLNTNICGLSARYFLILMQTPAENTKLISLSVTSQYEKAAEAVSVGTYSYPSSVNEVFKGFSNGFPYFGNGSLYISATGGDSGKISFFQRSGKMDDIRQAFVNAGYEKVIEIASTEVYQKEKSAGKYYTYSLELTDFTAYELIEIEFVSSEFNSLKPTSQWPTALIQSTFKDATLVAALTNGPSLSGDFAYNAVNLTETTRTLYLIVNNNDANLNAQFATNATIFKNYLDSIVTTYGLKNDGENGTISSTGEFSFYKSVSDSQEKFSISLIIDYEPSKNEVTFALLVNEYILTPYPSSLIEGYFGNHFPAFNTTNGQFAYLSSSESSTSTYLYFNVYDINSSEFDAYSTLLSNSGFEVYSYQYLDHNYYEFSKKEIDVSGYYTYYVQVNIYENYTYLCLRKTKANGTTSFSSAVNSIISSIETSSAFSEAVNLEDGEYYYDYNKSLIYCLGQGQEAKEKIIGACGEYNSIFGGYLYLTSEYGYNVGLCVNATVKEGYLEVEIKRIGSDILNAYLNSIDYEAANDSLTSYFNSISQDPNLYLFQETELKFYSSSNYLIVFGENVEEYVEAYKSQLLKDENMKYSSYLKKYIHTTTKVGVEITRDDTFATPFYTITFSSGNEFRDYVTYTQLINSISEFNLGAFPSLDLFGTTPSFYLGSNSDTYLSLYVTSDAYQTYLNKVANEFYKTSSSTYIHAGEDGSLYTINFYDYNYQINFEIEKNYFTSIDNIKNSYSYNLIIDDVPLPDEQTNIFRYLNTSIDVLYIEFFPTSFDKDAYIAKLLDNSFVLSTDYNGNPAYVKYDGNTVYALIINTDSFICRSYQLESLSYEEFVTSIGVDGFKSQKLDNFVVCDEMANHFVKKNSATSTYFTVLINNKELTKEAYGKLLEDNGFEKISSRRYEKGDTRIELDESLGYLEITYYDYRHVYVSTSELYNDIKQSNFAFWKLYYIHLPSNDGNYFELDSTNQYSLSFYYSSDFDINAYIDELKADSYIESVSSSSGVYLAKGNTGVQITYSNSKVTINCYETNRYLNHLLIEYYYEYMNTTAPYVEFDIPEEIENTRVTYFSVYDYSCGSRITFGSSEGHKDVYSVQLIDDQYLVVYSDRADDYGDHYIYVYDLLNCDTGNPFATVLSIMGLDFSSYESYSDIADIAMYGHEGYFKVDDGDAFITTFGSFLNTNSEHFETIEEKDGGYYFTLKDDESGNEYFVKQVGNNIIQVSI